MGRLRRSRVHKGIRDLKRSYRTRARTKDLDQVAEDLKPEAKEKILSRPADPDLPGMGKYTCVECAREFISEAALKEHCRGKTHKKRMKLIKETPYTLEEAERAAGLG
ncbi:hypothetical protein BJ684DRAFT_3863, partial [Piptocephalis cylindrospora]